MISAILATPIFAKIAEQVVGTLSDVITGDSDQKRAARAIEAELIRHINQIDLAQIGVNLEEAKHGSTFVAGWRPFVGWTCAAGLAYEYVFRRLFGDLVTLIEPAYKLPPIEMEGLIPLLMGLLGLGGMRSFEKIRGVARERMQPKEPEQ